MNLSALGLPPAVTSEHKNIRQCLLRTRYSPLRISEDRGRNVKGRKDSRVGLKVARLRFFFAFFSIRSHRTAAGAPIQFARHVKLSLSLSSALTGKPVTSHSVRSHGPQSALHTVIYRSHPSHIHHLDAASSRTSRHKDHKAAN